mgnify:FL=1
MQTTNSLSHEAKAMILESRFIRSNIAQFNENFNPKKTGAAIVNWEKKNRDLNYKMRKMYVVKKDIKVNKVSYKRGQKLLEKPNGVETREINFYEKNTRTAMKELLACFDWKHPNQIGFTKEKGICDIAQFNRLDYVKIVKLDLSNAFDSITDRQIEYLLRYTFKVNEKTAKTLARKWTVKGRMAQGHPLAPAIFNLLTRCATQYVAEHIKEMDIIQYADDILLLEKKHKYVSWKFLKHVFKKYENRGFSINAEKEGFFYKNQHIQHLGLFFNLERKKWVSAYRKRTRRRIRQAKRERNAEVERGNQAWLNLDTEKVHERNLKMMRTIINAKGEPEEMDIKEKAKLIAKFFEENEKNDFRTKLLKILKQNLTHEDFVNFYNYIKRKHSCFKDLSFS